MPIKPFPETENIIALPIPFSEFSDLATANIYALGKGPITLIDSGPKIPGSPEFIRKELNDAGFDFKDIERIIITHAHVDHFGLVENIRKAAGHPVECFIHSEDAWRASNEWFHEDMLKAMRKILKEAAGVPQDMIDMVMKRFSFYQTLADPLNDVTVMEDGHEFSGTGFHLRVIHTPGHSAGSCCLYETESKILFSGDHLIKNITPNPIMEMKREKLRYPEYQSLKAYLNSLDKVADLDIRSVFSGHGEYFTDLRGYIRSNKEHHQVRMDQVWNALKKEIRPLYQLVPEVFPAAPESELLLALSEIIVHLEILINQGRAELVDPGPPALYQAL